MDLNEERIHFAGHKECPEERVKPIASATRIKVPSLANNGASYQRFDETIAYRKDLAARKLKLNALNPWVENLRSRIR